MASDDVISDCGSELEESEASFTVDYEMEFEGSSDLVESNLYTVRGRTRSLRERTIDRHRMVYEEERKKKNWEKTMDRLNGDFNNTFLPSFLYLLIYFT